AQDDGIHQQAVLVDQVVGDERLDEDAASVEGNVLSWQGLDTFDLGNDITSENLGIAPEVGRFQVVRNQVLLPAVHEVAEHIARAWAILRLFNPKFFSRLSRGSPNFPPAATLSKPPRCSCHVLRPKRNVSRACMDWTKCPPMSSCQNGSVQAPWANPPSVSSST